MNKKNRGLFCISLTLIKDNPSMIVEMFYRLGIVIVRAEILYDRDVIEYTGISDVFKEVEQQYATPRYEIISFLKDNENSWGVKEIK